MIQLKNKKVAILGLMDPGIAALRLAQKEGAQVTGFGVATETDLKRIRNLCKGAPFQLTTEEIPKNGLLEFDVVILTPGGGRRYQAQVEAARAKGAAITTDLDLACERYQAPIIAVTGTNGKSTVVHLLKTAVEAAHKKAIVAGGDYTDFADSILRPSSYDFAILELNSTRLMRSERVKPHVAVFLNLYSGHSERHKNFKEYAEAKAKIFAHQTESDFLVYQQSEVIDALIKEKKCKAQLYPFSFVGPLKQGIYLSVRTRQIIFASEKEGQSTFSYANLGIAGTQNIENAMAYVGAAKLAGLPDFSIQQGLESVKALPDRMEFVQKINGVSYVNDAKSVNAVATYSGLHGFEDQSVILIAGGNYSPHANNPYLLDMMNKKVRCLIIFGTDRRDFHKVWGSSGREAFVVVSLKDAVELAYRKTEKGNTVFFSPGARPELHTHGSTQKRGEEFRRLVKETGEMEKAKKILTRRM